LPAGWCLAAVQLLLGRLCGYAARQSTRTAHGRASRLGGSCDERPL